MHSQQQKQSKWFTKLTQVWKQCDQVFKCLHRQDPKKLGNVMYSLDWNLPLGNTQCFVLNNKWHVYQDSGKALWLHFCGGAPCTVRFPATPERQFCRRRRRRSMFCRTSRRLGSKVIWQKNGEIWIKLYSFNKALKVTIFNLKRKLIKIWYSSSWF